MNLAKLLVGCALSMTSLSAQIAYPDDSVATDRSVQAPLGTTVQFGLHEARYQMLIPGRYLPPVAGQLTGISLSAVGDVPRLTYSRLTVTVSPTRATSLDTTFANNLPHPQVVFHGTRVTLDHPSTGWSQPFQFAAPVGLDGVSGLVIEFRKIYDPMAFPHGGTLGLAHRSIGRPYRSDLPPAMQAVGTVGSGAADRATGVSTIGVLKLQLHCDRPSLRLRGDPVYPSGNVFPIGAPFHATLAGASGTRFGLVLSTRLTDRRVPVPGILGAVLIESNSLWPVLNGTVPSQGDVSMQFGTPHDFSLIGQELAFQTLLLPPGGGPSEFGNAAHLIFNAHR